MLIVNSQHSKCLPISFYISWTVLSILLGTSIYVFLRPTTPVFFKWIYWLGLGNELEVARQNTLQYTALFPTWFLYALPDGLWAFGYTLFMFGFWLGKNSKLAYFWLCSVPLLIFGFEILQLLHTISGTFCWADMAFYTFGILFAYLLITTYRNYYYEKEIT